MKSLLDLTGQRFGRWLVLSEQFPRGERRRWLCQCDCSATRSVPQIDLRSGRSQSCGCERIRRATECATKHGHSTDSTYNCWAKMKARCTNPSDAAFGRYGGRGIRVCPQWLDFAGFYADMGDRPSLGHSLDRIDNDGHYEPSNCRWATRKVQNNNKRSNRLLEFNGRSQTLSEWADELGFDYGALRSRLSLRAWTVERALTTPMRFKRPRCRSSRIA